VAKDVATFLVWTASPEHDVRKKLFIKVGQLYIFGQAWARLKK
jgi:cytochrome c1